MTFRPLISVIIPLHNGGRYIAEAVDSVLRQSYTNFELIVVDDGSTDDGWRGIELKDRVRVFGTRQGGNAEARNHGLEQAEGELIAFLDQDDWWHPDKLAAQVEFMASNHECDAVISLVKYVIDDATPRPYWLHETIYRKEKPAYLLGALLAKRIVFNRVGVFNGQFAYGSDSDWFFRANETGVSLHILNSTLLFKRVHDDNQSHQIDESRSDLFRLIRDSMNRKRKP